MSWKVVFNPKKADDFENYIASRGCGCCCDWYRRSEIKIETLNKAIEELQHNLDEALKMRDFLKEGNKFKYEEWESEE